MIVPGLDENPLSVRDMVEHGYWLPFGHFMVCIFGDRNLQDHTDIVQMKETSASHLHLSVWSMHVMANRVTVVGFSWRWHKRFGHPNYDSWSWFRQGVVAGGFVAARLRLCSTSDFCYIRFNFSTDLSLIFQLQNPDYEKTNWYSANTYTNNLIYNLVPIKSRLNFEGSNLLWYQVENKPTNRQTLIVVTILYYLKPFLTTGFS